ncbi:protein kinase domain-containing protein [Citrus sinensis]|nr:protein kinase domain-containing protein [Citrus sinensis]
MTREDPSTSGQPLCSNRRNVVSSNRVDAERSVNNVCLRTGEEFSSEFLRDRVAVRRITVMNDGKYLQTIQAGVNINQNHQVVCGDLNGIVGLRRMDNKGNANASDFAGTFGYAVEAKKNNYPDNLSRCQLQYGAVGQNSGYAESPFTRKMKFLCSFGGRIFPRPSNGKLRYVGGETRIISVRKSLTWEELMRKTSAICNQPHTIKYQLPGEDLDALISVCPDEDLHHMIEEYQELERIGGSQRLRIFLVSLGEPDSPNSLGGKTTQQTDADNQYVSAVNGMLDAIPQRSSSGQTLASHTTQMGRDSPTFAYISEIKDHSPNSSNLGGMFSNNANRLPPIRVAGKSLIPSVPVTTFSSQRIDPFNSNAHFYVDWPCDGNGNDNPCVMDKFLCDHVNSLSHYDNLSHYLGNLIDEKHQGTTCQNQPLFKMLESCNDNFKTIQEIKAMNGNPASSDPHWKHLIGNKEVTPNNKAIENKITTNPAVKNSNATKDEKCALTEISQPVSPGSSVKLSSKDEKSTMTEISQPVTPGSSVKLSVSAQAVANQEWINPSSKLMNPASSREGTINDKDHKYYYGADKVFIRRVSSEGRKPRIALCAQTEPYKMLANQECINPCSKLTSTASSRQATINDEDPRIYYTYGAEMIFIRRSNEGQNPRIAVRAQVVQSENDYEHNVLIVEDLTDSIPPGIPSSSSVVPFEQDDVSDDYPSPMVTETESAHSDSGLEDVRGDGRDVDESISDATMAEMEAGIYGLKIIKDGDLEELEELGSGTFGTVYRGKWRGTDIAIKRIKKSCFLGRSSEQERLVGDFGLPRIKCNTLVSGGVRGTLLWMAPALLNGSNNRVSEKVDVYSFGMAMWEIITGEEPYANMQCGAIIGGRRTETPSLFDIWATTSSSPK